MVGPTNFCELEGVLVDRENQAAIDVFIGVDVGKKDHHAVALDRARKVLLDRSLPQDERRLRPLIVGLKAHGTLLFVVDQPATIGARSLPRQDAYVHAESLDHWQANKITRVAVH